MHQINISGDNMSNYMANAFAPYEAKYRAMVIQQTWGHLFPNKPKYVGKVRIAKGLYPNSSECICGEKDLPESSPWWYKAITEFAFNVTEKMGDGEVAEFNIQVDIVECIEQLEDWQIEEEQTPDEWTEIHITELDKTILVEAWD